MKPIYLKLDKMQKKYGVEEKFERIFDGKSENVEVKYEYDGKQYILQGVKNERMNAMVIFEILEIREETQFLMYAEKRKKVEKQFKEENVDQMMEQTTKNFMYLANGELSVCREGTEEEWGQLEKLLIIDNEVVYYDEQNEYVILKKGWIGEIIGATEEKDINEIIKEDERLKRYFRSMSGRKLIYKDGDYYEMCEYEFEDIGELRIFNTRKMNEITITESDDLREGKTLIEWLEYNMEIEKDENELQKRKKEIELIAKKQLTKALNFEILSDKLYKTKKHRFKKGQWVWLSENGEKRMGVLCDESEETTGVKMFRSYPHNHVQKIEYKAIIKKVDSEVYKGEKIIALYGGHREELEEGVLKEKNEEILNFVINNAGKTRLETAEMFQVSVDKKRGTNRVMVLTEEQAKVYEEYKEKEMTEEVKLLMDVFYRFNDKLLRGTIREISEETKTVFKSLIAIGVEAVGYEKVFQKMAEANENSGKNVQITQWMNKKNQEAYQYFFDMYEKKFKNKKN